MPEKGNDNTIEKGQFEQTPWMHEEAFCCHGYRFLGDFGTLP